jgi:hypothetical protein
MGRSERHHATEHEARNISLTLVAVTGIVLTTLVAAVFVGLSVVDRLEETSASNRALLTAINQQARAGRCAQDAAHRAEQLLIREIVKRSGRPELVKGLKLTRLPRGCDSLGNLHPIPAKSEARRGSPTSGVSGSPGGVPSPSPRPSPSPSPTCFPTPPICLPSP